MSTVIKDLGPVTAYADAVAAGYTGTKEEWQALMASYASVAEEAQEAKEGAEAAQEAAEDARDAAIDAKEGAEDAVDGFGAVVTQATNQAVQTVRAEGTTQVGNVSSEGTTQVNAVQAKGAEVLQSIPADYTELSNDVSQLKEDLTAEETAREAADNAINAELATKADADGTIASAEQLLSEKYTTDQEPYLFRPSGGSGADREYDEIVGGSIVWNQLVYNGNFANEDGWERIACSKAVSNNEITATATAAYGAAGNVLLASTIQSTVVGHKYLFSCDLYVPSTNTTMTKAKVGLRGTTLTETTKIDEWESITKISTVSTANNILVISSGSANAVGDVFKARRACVFDLTAMFGTTIADYIYSLEQATAGAGVAWFKKLFPKDYYAYDAGTMMHVSGLSSHDTVGFNAWDEEWELGCYDTNGVKVSSSNSIRCKNRIDALPSTYYYFNFPDTATMNNIVFFDADGNKTGSTYAQSNRRLILTPEATRYMVFQMSDLYGTTYKNDICINISDASRNGEYEPYIKHSYPLDDSLTLRGIPKLDANNQLYYDGDTYAADGTVTRKYGVRAYQSGDASDGSTMVTDGTNTVYKLTTPTTETATPFTNPQVCDPDGTEEYITTSIVPVGHHTKYPANLRSAIERVMEQVPEAPSANGTYTLKATRTSSGVTYAWTAE